MFVIAEPMKRLGRFTFADALDSRFGSRGIKAAAGISTLVVSIFYLIPQMVGAGALIQPLFNFPHWAGVLVVGVVVITIVVTAGMVSTTWVQFLKGSLLVVFSAILVVMLLQGGLKTNTTAFQTIGPIAPEMLNADLLDGRPVIPASDGWEEHDFVRLISADGVGFDLYRIDSIEGSTRKLLRQAQSVKGSGDNQTIDGAPFGEGEGKRHLKSVGYLSKLPDGQSETGPLGPISFLNKIRDSEVMLWRNVSVLHADGSKTTVYYQKPTEGSHVLRPGEHPKFAGIRSGRMTDRLNFLSLMLALFAGTASLPHLVFPKYRHLNGREWLPPHHQF